MGKEKHEGELYGGVETGGTWVNCLLAPGPQAILDEERFRTGTPGETIERIIAFFSERPRPAAVGIGAFGPIDLDPQSPTWGWVTNTPKPGWQHVSLARPIAERLSLPVAFDTDTAAAALAEYRWGAARERPTLAYLTVGTGIGAGLVHDGMPWHGLIHPEVGHIRIPHDRGRDPFPGACPLHGDCWEGLASGRAIAERWRCEPAGLPADHEGWELEAEYLAAGVLAIVSVASPHRVVVGGGVLEHPGLLERVRVHFTRLNAGYLEAPALMRPDYIVAPELGDRAGALGAVALAQLQARSG